MPVYINGLLLGLSLITALGPQNIFLIRQGAMRRHAILSATICFFCDVILVCGSIAGLNQALELHPTLRIWVTWFGTLFLFYYGFMSIRKALKMNTQTKQEAQQASNRLQILLLALGFSLLNPHAIIDSLVIIGGGSAQFPDHKWLFLCGVLTASFIWFSSLTFTTFYFSEVLSRAKVWRRIEFGSGILMLAIGLKLLTS
ncbi:LysE family transporter [Legionella birminghamensis]|uniref:LysE family transporter n=1 Tax=Legionella birminghamensis TaxID=28083 RepID=A0A378IDD3_9GAMM|nr:LysE family transporter [Legionella birminghamensis]KTC68821.1 LysE family transporter [Legionella birminghamensis]STX33237.1 LysE family transporter [Legionella birminghamensis]